VRVGVRLQAILRKYRPAGSKGDVVELELAEPATVRDAVRSLGVPDNLIHAVFVNDKQVALDAPLAPGDQVRIFPPVAGGAAAGL
jgi:molybdopterin converting factor small subunit